jgi:hypothetical protein
MNKTISTHQSTRGPLNKKDLGRLYKGEVNKKYFCLRLYSHVDRGSRMLIDAWIH